MERIFYSKKTSILFVAAMLVLLILVCMLLTTLTQMASMKQRAEAIQAQIDEAIKQGETYEEFLARRETDEYVIEWAERMGKLKQDQILWIHGDSTEN